MFVKKTLSLSGFHATIKRIVKLADRMEKMDGMKLKYSLMSDVEPDEETLAALMHEVAREAIARSAQTEQELRLRVSREISEALAREGFESCGRS